MYVGLKHKFTTILAKVTYMDVLYWIHAINEQVWVRAFCSRMQNGRLLELGFSTNSPSAFKVKPPKQRNILL